MRRKLKYLFAFLILIIINLNVSGQLSKGGKPILIEKLKSASYISDLVVMPNIDIKALKAKSQKADAKRLKPFTFAHAFDVSLNLNNSGIWYNAEKVNVLYKYCRPHQPGNRGTDGNRQKNQINNSWQAMGRYHFRFIKDNSISPLKKNVSRVYTQKETTRCRPV